MTSRIPAPHPRWPAATDALRLGHTERDSTMAACLLSLICGAAPTTSKSATGGSIRFRSGSSRLDLSARVALRRCSTGLRIDPGIRIVIGGFTRQVYFTPDAMGLALKRVDVIRAYLRSRGIGASRIEVAVCGAGWYLVERVRRSTEEDLSGRCLLEIVDPQWAMSRN